MYQFSVVQEIFVGYFLSGICYAESMSEATDLTNQVINHIYRQGGYAWRASSTGIFDEKRGSFRTAPKKGVADVLACYRGRMVAVEIKIGKDRLSPEQAGFLANLQHVGGLTFVAKDFPSFQAWFDSLPV